MAKYIELDAPNVSEREKEYLCRCIDSDYISTFGPFVPEFEGKFAKYLDVNGAVSIQSCTAALHMSLYELNIGPGDEVIVPVSTFVATVNPIMYVGATPVFVDIDIDTWNIDPQKIEGAITKKTKAIMPVHLYGNPCNMEPISDIAQKYDLWIIEDAAAGLGAKYKDRYVGIFGDFGCFSFNGNKIITTGGGGMIIGKDKERLKHIRFLANQARDKEKECYHPEIGFNYRMTNIEAALGLAQMEKLDEFLAKKRQFNRIYKEKLGKFRFIRFQKEYEEAEANWWLSAVIFEKEIDLVALQNELKNKGIPTRRIFMPVVDFPPYKMYKKEDYKNSYYINKKGICLPSSTLNSEENIYYVCEELKKIMDS